MEELPTYKHVADLEPGDRFTSALGSRLEVIEPPRRVDDRRYDVRVRDIDTGSTYPITYYGGQYSVEVTP